MKRDKAVAVQEDTEKIQILQSVNEKAEGRYDWGWQNQECNRQWEYRAVTKSQ